MKKIFILVFLVFACTASQAQFGVKGGINLANWGGDDADEEGKKSLIGPYFGIFYNVKCGGMFSFQPELVYSGQGVKFEDLGEEAKLVANYLNLTALARLNTSSGFFVGFGPQIGFLMSAKLKADGDEVDFKDDMKGSDIAAALAVGYELKSGFGFYARYNHGLSSVADDSDTKVFNRVIQIGLRYAFKGASKDKK
jgi:hypothetical protein